MHSAFGVDHGEVSKSFLNKLPKIPGMGPQPKPAAMAAPKPGSQKAAGLGQRAGAAVRRNLKPIAAGAGGFGLGSMGRNRNKPQQPRSL